MPPGRLSAIREAASVWATLSITLLLATHAIAHAVGSTPSSSDRPQRAHAACTCRGEAARPCPVMPLVGGRCLQRGAPAERRRPGSASAGGGRHAPPDVVALREPLDGDTWAVWVVGTQATGSPPAGFHPVTVGEQPVQIQGAAREDHGALFCPAHELDGGGGGQECAGRARRQVTRAQWPHRAVRLDARADDLDEGLHPGRLVCQSCGSSYAGLTPIKPLAVSLNRCETPPATGSLLEPPARSWALCGPLVPSSGAGTGARCRWPPRLYCYPVTPPPRADNPGPRVRCDRTQKYSGGPSGPGPERHSHESRCGGPLRHNSPAGWL